MKKNNNTQISSASEEKNILDAHDVFWQGYAQRDLDKRFSVCSDDVTFFGTGLHEHAIGIKQYRQMNEIGVSQSSIPFEIKILWKIVRVHTDIGWVECDTEWITKEHDKIIIDIIRLTTIFKKENNKWWVVHVHGSEPDYRLHDGEYMVSACIVDRNSQLERDVFIRTKELEAEKLKSDNLLLNILPFEVAEELKLKGSADAKQFDEVTVMFTDFKNFTLTSEIMSAAELVKEINYCYSAFDKIIAKHNIEKIKTIGDSYMCAGGLPVENKTHADDIINAALEIRNFMEQYKTEKQNENKPYFEIRIGVHTGSVVAGIVGIKKFAYDIWGNTVNIASRMESCGEAGRVNISGSTYELVKDNFNCIYRGKIQAKHKGVLDMYFVESK